MKKKNIMMLLVTVMTANLFSGCGNDAAEDEKIQTAISNAIDSQAENSNSPENNADGTETAEPTAEPTAQPTIEPAPTAEPTPEPSPEPQQVVTDEWAVDLYNALLKDDYKEVIELLGDASNTREKCEPYRDEEWPTWEGETAYSMLMEDGETVTVTILGEYEWEISAFVMYDRESHSIVQGDHCVRLMEDGAYSYIKDGNEVISADPSQIGFVFEDEGFPSWMDW